MRKIIVLVLVLAFFVLPAQAADLETMVSGHNLYSCICGAVEIKGEPKIDAKTGNASYTVANELFDVFFIKNGKVTGFGCVCRDPASEVEFLAQCVTACYNFAGDDAGAKCFDVILSQFMFARAGNPLGDAPISSKAYVRIQKEKFGYLFVLSVVD